MHVDQETGLKPVVDLALGEPEPAQLPPRDEAVLAGCLASDDPVDFRHTAHLTTRV
jgi:hypothetical protein